MQRKAQGMDALGMFFSLNLKLYQRREGRGFDNTQIPDCEGLSCYVKNWKSFSQLHHKVQLEVFKQINEKML